MVNIQIINFLERETFIFVIYENCVKSNDFTFIIYVCMEYFTKSKAEMFLRLCSFIIYLLFYVIIDNWISFHQQLERYLKLSWKMSTLFPFANLTTYSSKIWCCPCKSFFLRNRWKSDDTKSGLHGGCCIVVRFNI